MLHPHNVPNMDDEIAMDNEDALSAVHKLETIASQNGFTIHDVPYDGNCMFRAIAYQLNSTGVCDIDSNGLRQTIADFLEANKAQYWDFVCQPVAHNDRYNADTEPPTEEDKYIESIADPQLQKQLRWKKYLRCLKNGAWGDHITIQAFSSLRPRKLTYRKYFNQGYWMLMADLLEILTICLLHSILLKLSKC